MNPEQLADAGLCDLPTAEKWIDALNDAADTFGIDTPQRQAHWLAQCAHESGHFRFLSENLNYSAEALVRTFRKYFPSIDAARPYARQPVRIASKVYANRMGNGSESTQDGWKYRGRGLIQLTGRDNYVAFGEDIGRPMDILLEPDLVADPELAALSAAWFWDRNNLNALADKDDVAGLTRRINGGTNGLAERERLTDQALAVFLDD
jgi:putative chitinase